MIQRNTKHFASIVLCILSSHAVCFATDYYVDSASGNDAYNGLSSSAPWKTIARVNGTSFAPGDRILFARGAIWRESLMPRTSGTAGSPITFTAYGTGANPVIAGSNNLTSGAYSWRKSAGGTNEYYCYASGLKLPDTIWLNGASCTRGTAGSLADHQWSWGNLDSLGFNTVYLRDDSGSPATTGVLVESADRDYSIYGYAKSYLTFDGLEVRHTNDYGNAFGLLHFDGCKNITIRNCKIHDITAHGIEFLGSGSANHLIQDNTIYNALPIWSYPCLVSIFQTNTATASRNTIYNAVGVWSVGLTVQGASSNVTIEQNNIYNCNGDHVYLRGSSSGNTIRYNYLHDGSGTGVMIREGASDNKIYGNLIVETDVAVSINNTGGTTSNNWVYNNTCYNEAHAGYRGIAVVGNHPGTQIKDNCIWTNDEYALFADAEAAAVVSSSRNCFYNTSSFRLVSWSGVSYLMSNFVSYQGTSGQDAGSVARNPVFTNPSGRDFSLQSSSPCINAGADLGDAYRYALAPGSSWPSSVQALDQRSYSAWEMGAYVYGSAPPATTYTLAVSATYGTVTKTPNQSSYASGASVSLQATANSGYAFSGWSGDLTGTTNPATLVIDTNKSVTASFNAIATYTLTISATNGSVSKNPDKAAYTYGELVTLQATPNTGYSFAGWSGGASGTSPSTTVTMNANKAVTASFTANTYTLTISAANGSVSKNPDKAAYTYAEAVTLQATPSTGYTFAGWSGDASGTSPSTTVTMNANKAVTASFTSQSADRVPPVLTGCSPAPDSIQAPPNTLVTLHLRDEGAGVDPGSASIAVGGRLVYSGDTDSCRTAYGVCRRYGTKADYTYVYQQAGIFNYSTETAITVNARDLAGNAMSQQTYSFAVEMYSFGLSRRIVGDQTSLSQAKPITVCDNHGEVWTAWQAGSAGGRHIYVSHFSPDTATSGRTTQLSQGTGDHCNPTMTTDGAGNLYIVWQENTRGTWDVCLSSSANGGTWSTPRRISDPNNNQVNPAIYAGRAPSGLVAVAWQDDRAGNQDIYAARSTDRFLTSAVSRVTSNSADQIDPAIAVDCQDRIVVLWADARNGSTDIYGAASDNGPWTNVPVANGGANQSCPAVAAGSTSPVLYMAWVDDGRGNPDVYYASSQGLPASPVTGANVIDDTSGADQRAPVIAVAAGANGSDKVFACWEDSRNVAQSGDTDLYFADVSPGAISTNVLVDDRGTNSNQKDAALGVDSRGYPYIAWADDAATNPQIYCSGATYADPVPVAQQEIAATSVGTVGTPPASITTTNDVSVVIPALASPFNAAISIAQVRNPQGFSTDSLHIYEFGPSGLSFAQPVTITIPYNVRSTSGKVRAYWYDSVTGTFSSGGITDVQDITIGSRLHALRFKTTHFTPFYLMAENAASAGGGAGGGCSLAAQGQGDPAAYFIPYLVIAAAMILWRRRDTRRSCDALPRSNAPQE